MKFRLLLLTCFLSFSCQLFRPISAGAKLDRPTFPSYPILWSFSCTFPQERKEVVRNAIAYWESEVGHPMFKEDKGCAEASTDFLDHPAALAFESMDVYAQYPDGGDFKEKLAECSDSANEGKKHGFVAVFKPALESSDNYFESIIRHEIGHALGLDHSERTECLMYKELDKRYNSAPKPLCADELHEVREAYP